MTHKVAKHSLFQTPLVSFFLKVMRAVPVAKAHDAGLSDEKQATPAERQRMNDQMFKTVGCVINLLLLSA